MAKSTTNKSAFIRNLPVDMPASTVVAMAKEANLKVTPAFVYAIRSKTRAKNKGKAARGAAAPARNKSASGKPTASDFVRTQPTTMKAGEVVAAGAKQGIKFSTNLVYAVRSGSGRRSAGKTTTVSSGGSEATLRKIALDIGIPRAREVIDELERKLRALIG